MDNFEIVIITGVSADGKVTLGEGVSSKKFAALLSPEMSEPLLELRRWADVILVGRKTVKIDNPSLKSNENSGLIRAVIDREMRLSLDKNIFDGSARTLIITTSTNKEKERQLRQKGVEIIRISQEDFLPELKNEFEERGLYKIMVEGGGNLNYFMLKNHFVDKIIIATFPFIVGGKDTPTIVDGESIATMKEAIKLKLIRSYLVDKNMVVNEFGVEND